MPIGDSSDDVSERPQQKSDMQLPGNPPAHQDIRPNPADDIPDKDRSAIEQLGKNIKTGEWLLIGIGLLTLAVNIVVAKIYYGQLVEMREATKATKDAVQVARDTLNASQQSGIQIRIDSMAESAKSEKRAQQILQATVDNFHQDQRAWIGVIGLVVDNPQNLMPIGTPFQGARVRITNSGKSPALNVKHLVVMDAFLASVKPDFKIIPGRGQIKSASTILPGVIDDLKPEPLEPVTTQNVADIRDGKAIIYVWGKVTYTDVFKKSHTTFFCDYLRKDLVGYAACDKNNQAD